MRKSKEMDLHLSESDLPLGDLSFEEGLNRLEEIVDRLGNPELPLEEALELFEKGIRYLRHCEVLLKRCERKVELLLADGTTEPFPDPT
jgi:exodeoxyribonuclease VII small subunit